MGGTRWTRFHTKDKKSFYFDSFGGHPVEFLFQQLAKPISYHSYKIGNINSRLCGTYCLYFLYLRERMKHRDAVLKISLG